MDVYNKDDHVRNEVFPSNKYLNLDLDEDVSKLLGKDMKVITLLETIY